MNMREDCDEVADLLSSRCLAMRLRRVNRLVTAIYERRFRGLNITIAQVNILAAIQKLGPERASAAELSRVLLLEPSTTSRNLDRIEERGWIRRLATEDPRREALELTSSGQHILLSIREPWEAAQRESEQELGPKLTRALLE